MVKLRKKIQEIPEEPPESMEIAHKIKDWALKAGIAGKEITPLPPEIEYALQIRYAPQNPTPLNILCEFPKGQDFLVLRFRTKVNPEHDTVLENSPDIKKQFIAKILELSLLSNIDYTLHLGGQKPYYWDFMDTLYFDGFNKDNLFRHYQRIGGISQYFINLFATMFLKQDQGIDAKDFKPA